MTRTREENAADKAREESKQVMVTFKLVFSEERTQVRRIEVEVEAETIEQAAEAAVKASEQSKYDTALEEAEPDTTECRDEVAYYNDKGEYVILLPWD